MSITLLEFVVAAVLLVVAWQLGIAIAPLIINRVRGLKNELDETVDEIRVDSPEGVAAKPKEEPSSKHNYRNN